MLPMLDEKNLTYQHLIANHFGYEDNYVKNYYKENFLNKKGVKVKIDVELVEDNTTHRCICCGNTFPIGFIGKDLLKKDKIFTKTFNNAYSLAKPKNKDGKHFICGPCLHSLKNYNKTETKMQNIIVFKNRVEKINIRSNTDNEMYEYILGKYNEPFIMIINSRGKVLEYLTYLAFPTISDGVITIIFGEKIMQIKKVVLKECLRDTLKLIDKYNINKNVLLNTKRGGERNKFLFIKKNIENKALIKELGIYHNKYNENIRIITGKLIEKYKILNKEQG
jgi:hypothetical protein